MFKVMMLYFDNKDNLSLLPRKAADRLSAVIQLDSILQYAATLRDASELKVIRKMICDMALRSRCRKADAVELAAFIDTLIADCLRPPALQQYNSGCQQFFGPMDKPEIHSSNRPSNHSSNHSSDSSSDNSSSSRKPLKRKSV